MKQVHQTFIIEMIKHSDKTMAYQKAYPQCTDNESARKSAERLLRHHPEIAQEIEDATAHIRHRAYVDAYRLHTEQQKTKLLSVLDKREILARIAKCEIKVCRYIKDGDRYRMLFEDPHPREIMKAIEADGRIEDRCNRARNLAGPKLSQFNIYIDGRPCNDPTAPVNPDLPPGLIMLPRTRKKLNPEQGNNSEHSNTEDIHSTSPLPGDLGVNLPLEKISLAEQGNNPEQNNKLPLPGGVGVGSLAHEKTQITEQGNNPEQNNKLPLLGGVGVGLLAQEKTQIAEQGNNSEQKNETPLLFLGGENGEGPTGVSHSGEVGSRWALAPQNSPLYRQYLALYEKRKLQAEDLMCDSFYSRNKAAEAAVPPPHILTDEEVWQFHAEADRQLEEKRKQKQPQQPYNTFGKMYFPPEGR